uniref:cysteine desulfurase family protein n=1 Tax=Parolsenella massiliensis TaxID=1871022 RepID=UPI0009340168|nr:cysteine desulfurase family protein [Parolsenella massiliensis]
MAYLDNAATTRTSAAAIDAMRRVMEGEAFANPASQHAAGDAALRALEGARREVAACLHARPNEVEFVSCGSEANNQALLTGAAYGAREGRRHIVASAIEHASVLRMLDWLASADGPFGGGFDVTLVRPNEGGVVSVAAVKEALREDTCLVSLMYANNEVGSVQPVRDVCRMCRKRGILFHTDAVQAAGHLPIDFTRDGFDLLSVSAHKFHGPRGTGALLCSHRVVPTSLVLGGAQERGHRAGTANVAGAAGMAMALREASDALEANKSQVERLRERFAARVSQIGGVHVLGPADASLRLPGIVALTVDGVDHEPALVLLDEAGVCVSAGSACAAGAVETSHVLSAMGASPEVARTYLRVSIDASENSAQDIDTAASALAEVAARLRGGAR